MKQRNGFTIIEVALFLAVTGFLFLGIAGAMQNSIAMQRFNDSVQNFAEFLRSIYSEVSNPQSVGTGRSDTAIYGKLVVFGESEGLEEGEELTDGINADGSQKVYVYDVVAPAEVNGTGESAEMLLGLGANVVYVTRNASGKIIQVEPAGEVQSYTVRWAAQAEYAYDDGVTDVYRPWTGSIMVVRHPRSGTINTLVSTNVVQVNELVNKMKEILQTQEELNATQEAEVNGLLVSELGSFNERNVYEAGSLSVRQVNFCINPYGSDEYEQRRLVRLTANARNASGVEIFDLDSNENICRQ